MGTRVQHSIPLSIERACLAVAREIGVPRDHVTVICPNFMDRDVLDLEFRVVVDLRAHRAINPEPEAMTSHELETARSRWADARKATK